MPDNKQTDLMRSWTWELQLAVVVLGRVVGDEEDVGVCFDMVVEQRDCLQT